jgi:hypothetical protein
MDCRRMEQLISPYLDGELTPAEAAAVGAHLSVCANCKREYEAILRISIACRQMREVLRPAPAGFKDALMAHISNTDQVVTPIVYKNRFSRGWKQAGAAAAVLMLLGAAGIQATPVLQLAHKIPALIQTGNSGSVAINTTNEAATTTQPGAATSTSGTATPTQGTITPTPRTNNATKPQQVASVPSTNSADSTPVVFLNKQRFITTVLLQVKVTDPTDALEQATELTAAVQATTHNLGQQVNATGSYTVLKIVVAKSSASSLITALGSLGTVSGQDVDNKDISTYYTDTLSQYQTLVTQRATLQDASQKAGLDQRINALVSELQDWEQKADQETIVLWLEK